jgi:hypothetical protein
LTQAGNAKARRQIGFPQPPSAAGIDANHQIDILFGRKGRPFSHKIALSPGGRGKAIGVVHAVAIEEYAFDLVTPSEDCVGEGQRSSRRLTPERGLGDEKRELQFGLGVVAGDGAPVCTDPSVEATLTGVPSAEASLYWQAMTAPALKNREANTAMAKIGRCDILPSSRPSLRAASALSTSTIDVNAFKHFAPGCPNRPMSA